MYNPKAADLSRSRQGRTRGVRAPIHTQRDSTVQPEEGKTREGDVGSAPGRTMDDAEALVALSRHVDRITDELAQTIVGQQEVIEQLLIALLAGGHVLLVGVPGLAKTLLVSSLARSMDLTFHRIQFTPDLMPPDITGTEVLQEDRSTGAREFRFIPGPIFANVVLADEINRTPPKTQAALLEAMQEHQVTAAGRRHDLPSPFFVLATQNPIEQEGTYPLPEAQLDRFMFNVLVDYPDQAEEVEIVLRTTSDHVHQPQPTVSVVRRIAITPALALTATQIARLTRPKDPAADDLVRQYVRWGAGPRASQYIVLGAKARAAMQGSPVVRREDIQAVAPPVLRHRMRLNFQAEAAGISVEEVIQHVLSNVDRSLESGPSSEQLAKVLRT